MQAMVRETNKFEEADFWKKCSTCSIFPNTV